MAIDNGSLNHDFYQTYARKVSRVCYLNY